MGLGTGVQFAIWNESDIQGLGLFLVWKAGVEWGGGEAGANN